MVVVVCWVRRVGVQLERGACKEEEEEEEEEVLKAYEIYIERLGCRTTGSQDEGRGKRVGCDEGVPG